MDPQASSSDVPSSCEPLARDSSPANPWAFRKRTAGSKAIADKIQSMYDSGVPLFRKDVIRHTANQLALYHTRPRNERQVTLIDISGNSVKYSICLPFFNDGQSDDKSDTEVIERIRLDYRSLESFIEDRVLDRRAAPYLTTSIVYCTWERQKISGGLSPHGCVEDLRQIFEDIRSEWDSSKQHDELQQILASLKPPIRPRKVIAFALGSLYDVSEDGRRSMTQHALLMSLRHGFSNSTQTTELECFSQEPRYSDNEKQVLQASGVKVLEDPMGFLEVDETSVVLSIAPNVPVKQIVTDIARPAVIIWTKPPEPPYYRMTDPESSRVREMLDKEYTRMDFPHHDAYTPLYLYVRKASAEGVSELKGNDRMRTHVSIPATQHAI